jgi:hypothetical protein
MRKVLATEGGISQNGLKKARHICRGHFSEYSEEKPLFGKYEVQRPGKVLVMNAEDPKKQLQRRLIQLANHMEWDSDEQKFEAFENVAFVDFEIDTISLSAQVARTNHYDITKTVEEIIKAYKEVGLSWVIFDPMTLFGFDEAGGNDSAYIKQLKSLMREQRRSITMEGLSESVESSELLSNSQTKPFIRKPVVKRHGFASPNIIKR